MLSTHRSTQQPLQTAEKKVIASPEKKRDCWLCEDGRHHVQRCTKKRDLRVLLQRRQALLDNAEVTPDAQDKLAQLRYFLKQLNVQIVDEHDVE
jgi:hypothetical protein